mgnify:CR=1 FL=1
MSNLELEKKLWGKSFNYICGLDEVGRGCIAGPVYSGAVILKENFEDPDDLFRKINDSKIITAKKRETLSAYIKKISHTSSIGSASSEEIDNIGIVKAVKLSMIRAIKNLKIKSNKIVSQIKLNVPTFKKNNLPNYLKPGVVEYGKTSMKLANGSSIGISTTSSDAGRGRYTDYERR